MRIILCLLQYEDETLQAMALSCIPDDELREKAQQEIPEAHARGETLAEQDALAKQLLEWFKRKFFTWVSFKLHLPSKGLVLQIAPSNHITLLCIYDCCAFMSWIFRSMLCALLSAGE